MVWHKSRTAHARPKDFRQFVTSTHTTAQHPRQLGQIHNYA